MGSFQPTNTLLLLAATDPSSWSIHLSRMFVGVMFSGVVLAKWSLSSGAVNFNKLSISLKLDASNPTAHHAPHHSSPPRKIVSRFRTQPFPRLHLRLLSLVLSRRRHSRARLPVPFDSVSTGRTVRSLLADVNGHRDFIWCLADIWMKHSF